MVRSPGVKVQAADAEATRRRLREAGHLRTDLAVARDGTSVVFPVDESCGPRIANTTFDFEPRDRPTRYQDLLPWDEPRRAAAPRAFDQLGDIIIVKVPDEQDGTAIGDALMRFTNARAVFHDDGVEGGFRVRRLRRIAGAGTSRTEVNENGIRLTIDPAAAYYSPRLAAERARVAAMVRPGERLIDMFAGVGALAIQAAKAGARVDAIDLNPEAIKLLRENVAANQVEVAIHLGDAGTITPTIAKADRVVMNLPHGAGPFLDAALATGAHHIHFHEILATTAIAARSSALAARTRGTATWRIVRNYSARDAHVVFDLEVPASRS